MPTTRWAVAAVATLLVACTSTPSAEPETGPMRPPGIAVAVENGSSTAFRVFALVRGDETLIGRADPLRNTELRLPAGLSGQVALVIRPSAGRGTNAQHRSEPFSVSQGQRVEWRLRPSAGSYMPQISSVAVYACGETERC